ncbi:MAG TPA: 2-dehydro-3-deoxy-6-phosphogalactonate aldolase [Ideonella sp.]|uniref:2-dehydro-3-deoxy-6-phosphogalactonate aldolase n=1 Tax=Ideonella sp. TaxID=1929293 RepID=UPI002E32A089|nr:2-dehydro-3-deoxy-6-phosphogalactonate aldolase [Ideonella sp.]HEX5687833.1 2-dehydro-3-deoxy-6-phosphogalactonate aldolase [Ideonella sp.]
MTTHVSTTWPPQPPLVAILRGLTPADATDVGRVLLDAGFQALEVPLNRDGALESIAQLVKLVPADVAVGAGTVTHAAQVDAVAATGANLIVSPHLDLAVVAHACELGLRSVPGVFTASEAFAALRAGADALKLFPAEAMPPAGLQALASVLPPGTELWPVGGVTPESMANWRRHGATGFGIGGALYRPGVSLAVLRERAQAFVAAWSAIAAGQ